MKLSRELYDLAHGLGALLSSMGRAYKVSKQKKCHGAESLGSLERRVILTTKVDQALEPTDPAPTGASANCQNTTMQKGKRKWKRTADQLCG